MLFSNDPTYCTLSKIMDFSQIRLFNISSKIFLFNLIKQLFSNFESRIFFSKASYSICSSFVSHIMHIICLSAKKQMIRVNTFSIIAFMANMKTRHSSKSQLPYNSVGSFKVCTNSNSAISVLVQLASPFPTTVRAIFIDFIPESILQSLHRHKITSDEVLCQSIA